MMEKLLNMYVFNCSKILPDICVASGTSVQNKFIYVAKVSF